MNKPQNATFNAGYETFFSINNNYSYLEIAIYFFLILKYIIHIKNYSKWLNFVLRELMDKTA